MPFGGITDDYTCWKPIIAAVNGYALGGGLELVLACDLAIASDAAQFGAPEGKVGLVAAAGGVHRLPRQVPLKIAMGMLLAGRFMSAEDALHYGLVNEVVPGDELAAAAERMASEIVANAPLSARAHKQMAMTGLGLSLDNAMAADYSENERAMASDDFIEGPRAFAEKRKPVWTGE
jgi:enoyl-CoA hydratase/carnithine racemase